MSINLGLLGALHMGGIEWQPVLFTQQILRKLTTYTYFKVYVLNSSRAYLVTWHRGWCLCHSFYLPAFFWFPPVIKYYLWNEVVVRGNCSHFSPATFTSHTNKRWICKAFSVGNKFLSVGSARCIRGVCWVMWLLQRMGHCTYAQTSLE